MIAGIGTDFLEIDRIQKMLERHRTVQRIFTKRELMDAENHAATLAGNFAVKEAVSKVFGTGFFGMEPFEIEVLRKDSGAPYVNLYGKAQKIAEEQQIDKIHVTITNTKNFVQAFAIGERL